MRERLVNGLTALYNLDSRRLTVFVLQKIRENPTTFGQFEVQVEGRRTVLPSGSSAAPTGFPVELVGADEPYAAYLKRKPLTRSCPVQRTGNPGPALDIFDLPIG